MSKIKALFDFFWKEGRKTEINEGRLVKLEERLKVVITRLDNYEKKLENIHELTLAVKEIAMETKATREDVNDMNKRLKIVEEKPAKNWDKVTSTIIGTVVGTIAGAIIGLILK